MSKIYGVIVLMAAFLAFGGELSAQDVSEGYWEINGTRLHYVMMGEGAPIVVLHGGPGGNLISKLGLVSFAPEYRWVFYDQRGTGKSDRIPIHVDQLDEAAALFSIERQIEDLEQVRARLGADKITFTPEMVNYDALDEIYVGLIHPDHIDPSEHVLTIANDHPSLRSILVGQGDVLKVSNNSAGTLSFYC